MIKMRRQGVKLFIDPQPMDWSVKPGVYHIDSDTGLDSS
ncbi:Uncharacterised protein [Legionella wadsworthii]|uniref:Uncharacterized protein n=1 Tax=Legionella wadsworthii TaxID=28088 RepID=A0A378LXX9_9GAMM|nr:Uncharacterised protein [Legionella wadsworthii]